MIKRRNQSLDNFTQNIGMFWLSLIFSELLPDKRSFSLGLISTQ